ncbi:kinesin-like protein KIN-1 [Dioscorea cayenensis subsp. rotundata]|uniref:Kinesin-like protein n=1 Tax=Dioscorea cayennensis subsp. rotundata TaxID=55577 RepID=A0AB40B4L8_DIOCR|nr:kinesin-like protein KIN-1 [Dioscorea cayenensis subsp. rotundata]
MSNVTVCVRFRPLSLKEKKVHGDSVCITCLDRESFIFKDEKEEDLPFCFDRVFYQDSAQADVYEFLALPIVQDTVKAINGTIITYGQTGAGKTYSMEGLGILDCDENKKGLLPRVVDGLFQCINSSPEDIKYAVKLSMVEIYMEKVRDLFDLSKDNVQIKENKSQGIILSGASEMPILNTEEALKCLSRGISNRAVGETQMNVSSSRSHCVYVFSVQRESAIDKRVKTGKLILVDLAGSEKVEKTGAEGKVLEEAKNINKSLSSLGNVINALTNGRGNHIPYRDSKLTRILQDALGGNSRTALLCCCSPSSSNASESLSTLRFGTRTKLIKTPPRTNTNDANDGKAFLLQVGDHQIENSSCEMTSDDACEDTQVTVRQSLTDSRDKILTKLRENLKEDDVRLLEELFIVEGIFFNPSNTEEFESACDDIIWQTVSALERTVQELRDEVEELNKENYKLKSELAGASTWSSTSVAAEGKKNHFTWAISIVSLANSLIWLFSMFLFKP